MKPAVFRPARASRVCCGGGSRTRAWMPLMKALPRSSVYLSSRDSEARAWSTCGGSGAFIDDLLVAVARHGRRTWAAELVARRCGARPKPLMSPSLGRCPRVPSRGFTGSKSRSSALEAPMKRGGAANPHGLRLPAPCQPFQALSDLARPARSDRHHLDDGIEPSTPLT